MFNTGGLDAFCDIRHVDDQNKQQMYSDLKSLQEFSAKNGNPKGVIRIKRGGNEKYELRPLWKVTNK